ncbi:MAG: class I SAM-dependent methyltransferase [Phycisphaerales bacterium]|nr:class I SAM-dependent methyltransferase [Phycisphaerales bacterium]
MKPDASTQGRWFREEHCWTGRELAWLRSPPGRAVCAAMLDAEPANTPAAIARWRQRIEPWQVTAAWSQVLLRRNARAKFSRADAMLFDRIALEQATDETVAQYKAERFAGLYTGRAVADLCCGIGGDAIAIAEGSEVLAVDWSATRVAMAEHNADVYGRRVAGIVADVTMKLPDAEAAHIDPDRRVDGGRRHQPEESSPRIDVLTRLVQHYRNVAVKLSPGADLDHLTPEGEVELISHHGQCKQAVLWTGALATACRRATALPNKESITAGIHDDLSWPEPAKPVEGNYLFEPDPAVIRANLVGLLARRHTLQPIDPRIVYLVGNRPVKSALLTAFQVIDLAEWAGRKARAWLNRHDIGQIEIKTRGFAARPEEIQKQLRLTGRRRAVLFLTRIGPQPIAILAKRIDLNRQEPAD